MDNTSVRNQLWRLLKEGKDIEDNLKSDEEC